MKQLTKEQAREILISSIDNLDIQDKLYELAQDLCYKAIKNVEDKYIIISNDNIPYTNEDDEKWYDDYREEFQEVVFEKISALL